MRQIGTFISMILMAAWLGAIAIVSIQNIEIVSLKFLIWESVKLPFGVLLALSVGTGLMIGGLLPVGQNR